MIRYEEGQLEEARKLYEKALEIRPFYHDARVNLAQCLFEIGLEKAAASETNLAAKYFDQAIQLDGEKALYHYNYALAVGRLGYLELADTHLKEALRIIPDLEPANELLKRIEADSSGSTQFFP